MKRFLTAVAMAASVLAGWPTPGAAIPAADATRTVPPDYSWQDKLERKTGEVVLAGPRAKLMLGESYYFLGAEDARRVLTEGWGNPPEAAASVLGLIVPVRFKPLEARAWAVVVTFDEGGYVSDKDAGKIDPDKLLTDLRSGEDENNAARTKAGYPATHLVGWAEPPSYHAQGHYVIWAQDIQFGDSEGRTLNYDIRLLGRRGVLSLNVVAAMDDLAEVRSATSSIVGTAAFQPGSRYADFEKGKDKVAEYGVAGLIAAGLGVAAVKKLGLLGLILAFGKKAIILVVAAFGGIAAWIRRALGGRGNGSGGSDLVS